MAFIIIIKQVLEYIISLFMSLFYILYFASFVCGTYTNS